MPLCREHKFGLHYEGVGRMNVKSLYKQRGLSLIELLIAMGLGVLLLMGLITVFGTANQSSKRRSTSENLDEVRIRSP